MATRRTFLTTSSLAAMAVAGRPSSLLRSGGTRGNASGIVLGELPGAGNPQLKALAQRALGAAKAAGATYADVRFTVTRRRTFVNVDLPTESETVAVGVRALAKGAWGFAAHTEWTPEIIAQLGQKAAAQARVNAWPRVPPITLIDHPPAAVGNWQTPVTRDPFTVPVQETTELLQSAFARAKALRGGMAVVLTFERQERTFASTDGAFLTQTIYTSLGGSPHQDIAPSSLVVGVQAPDGTTSTYVVPSVSPRGAGYEVVDEMKIADHLPEWFEKARSVAGAKPFDAMGQHDVVFDAAAMAAIVNGSLGTALEYDRTVGYEANAGGTSYLMPPLQMLGTALAPTTVTVTADRTLPTGAGTVRWDDEGIATQALPLILKGQVVDYATSREFVAELAPWYQKQGMPVRSNGCAGAESALAVPLVQTPNLILHPATTDSSVDALIAGIAQGFAVFGGNVQMDIQQRSGRGRGAQVYAIKQGKLTAPVAKSVYLFRSTELWKNLVALGGAQTATTRGFAASKGQPDQSTVHSVQAVAAHFREVRLGNADRT